MATLEQAILLATKAHEGQEDKGGDPYIYHPFRVMLQMDTETEKIVAVLHDVVEDTPYTLDDLRREGFSEEIISALDCLTRREGQSYEDYIRRIKGNPLACKVKIADLQDNMNLQRIPCPQGKDRERVRKYARYLAFLDGNP